jgi:hypothetical protein
MCHILYSIELLCPPVDNDSRHKKTTHRFDRRFAESVGVSTADAIRLPNSAGFGIRYGVSNRGRIGHFVVHGTKYPLFSENKERF